MRNTQSPARDGAVKNRGRWLVPSYATDIH